MWCRKKVYKTTPMGKKPTKLNWKWKSFDGVDQCFSIPVLMTHCPVCFGCFPPPHLIQMNGSLSGHCRAWWRADHLNRVWWRRETSKTCRVVGHEDRNWETLDYGKGPIMVLGPLVKTMHALGKNLQSNMEHTPDEEDNEQREKNMDAYFE